jgi:hypothetical protein
MPKTPPAAPDSPEHPKLLDFPYKNRKVYISKLKIFSNKVKVVIFAAELRCLTLTTRVF